ncbi:MAG: glycolate oxidase subunit GlcF [Gammaproteobacteria bacterium]|nr:MAG: glycolate oxidase subunit GlcF [Gammaproteobacteria bacterium]
MQTRLTEAIRGTASGEEAESILRRCVHCGFCNATCPTYILTGNELEGPRGRIYLIKSLLEGEAVSHRTRTHLDHCLGCRACETTCPSGVSFHRLADIGRETIASRGSRPTWDRWRRRLIARFFDHSLLFRLSIAVARMFRWLLPSRLARLFPVETQGGWPESASEKTILLHEGCVQPTIAPSINLAAARVLDRRGFSACRASGCCGAMAYHLDDLDRAREQIRGNIDAWYPALEGSEGLVVTASGCAAFIKDYGALCRDDPDYAGRADFIADRVSDVGDFLSPLKSSSSFSEKVAFHVPCTLKNALHGDASLRRLLTESGWTLKDAGDGDQCCGSAGAYSLLHRETSRRLRESRLERLDTESVDRIVTANIGCLIHLSMGTDLPVQHWIEVWDEIEESSEPSGSKRL